MPLPTALSRRPTACLSRTAPTLPTSRLQAAPARASVQSPAELTVKDGKVTAKIVWSSKNYDYMKVGDTKYDTVIEDEHSTFEIPVSCFDWAMAVKADTTAMSEAHEIDYTLTFDSPLSRR